MTPRMVSCPLYEAEHGGKITMWIPRACPHCVGIFRGALSEDDVQILPRARGNAMSRRDKCSICVLCGKAEAMADFLKSSGIDDVMARIVIAQEWQEGRRLPAGTQMPSGFVIASGELAGA